MSEIKKIHKVRQGRVIDGVCGGVAVFTGIDAIWVRIAWVALALAGGIGVIAYIIGMYLFPRHESEDVVEQPLSKKASGVLLVGAVLLGLGVMIVLRLTGVLEYGFWGAWHLAWVVLWPLTLIGGGLLLLFVYWRETSQGIPGLKRTAEDKMLIGVCGGLGRYFKIDPNIVRFVFALIILLSRGVGLLIYVVIGLLAPSATDEAQGA
ncbi:MAG: PspC domain-containing protein [Candidatus Eisenbacteria bacterium]|jgi:phage shock protein PspC (stress-responsive transcriptional regulator)